MNKEKILMCTPTSFRIDYIINPHMQGQLVSAEKALSEWQVLYDSLIAQNIKVELLEQNVDWPDMVFATDQAIVIDNQALLSNFRYSERAGETYFYKKWFQDNGYQVSERIRDIGGYLEGGDVQLIGNTWVVGTGFRSNSLGVKALQDFVGKNTILEVSLVDDAFYHLDTAFFSLNQDTCYWYPTAFSDTSQKLIKSQGWELREVTKTEALNFACNSVVYDDTVFTVPGNPRYTQLLESDGYKVIEVPMNEYLKSGGGPHCLICNFYTN